MRIGADLTNAGHENSNICIFFSTRYKNDYAVSKHMLTIMMTIFQIAKLAQYKQEQSRFASR